MESTDQPTAIVLSRQNLPTLPGTKESAYEGVKKGAYVVSDSSQGEPDAILLATGSEVQLAVEAQKVLREKNIDASVVSMPSWDRFEAQTASYKESVLLPNVKKRVAIEMASSFGWDRYLGNDGVMIGIDTFGASGNGNKLTEEYGFCVDNIVAQVERLFV